MSGHAANWWFHQVPDVPVAVDLYDPFPDREPALRARARRGDRAARPRSARARARPRRLLPLRLGRAAALLRGRALRRRADRAAELSRRIRALARLLAVVPFGVPAEPARGRPRRRDAARSGVAAVGPLVLFGGVYDWYDPELLLAAWPEILRRAAGRAAALLREPESGDDAPARLRARPGARAADRSGRALDPLLARGCRTPRARTSTRRRTCSSRSRREGLETELAYRTRLLDAAWGGLPSVAVGGGSLARELAAAGAGARVRPATPTRWPEVAALLPTRRAATRAGDGARAFAAARTWRPSPRPSPTWCREARVDPGRLPRRRDGKALSFGGASSSNLPSAVALPEASIVVVHHRGLEHLLEALAALDAAVATGLTAEILLVDNASGTPRDAVLRRHPSVRARRLGRQRGLRRGLPPRRRGGARARSSSSSTTTRSSCPTRRGCSSRRLARAEPDVVAAGGA